MATWSEPFSLEGEELSYIVSITNTASGIQYEVTVNSTTYVSEPIEERDCAKYIRFTIFSNNSYSKSRSGVSGLKNIPTGAIVIP